MAERCIISIFANPPANRAGFLAYLQEESREMGNVFTDAKAMDGKTLVESTLNNNVVRKESIDKIITKFKKKCNVLHYSGHADNIALNLGDENFGAGELITYINTCPALKLVVLNGCSTAGFVKKIFTQTTVQAVIATSASISDLSAYKFSVRLYEKFLVEDETLEMSFRLGLIAAGKMVQEEQVNVFTVNAAADSIKGITGLSSPELHGGEKIRASKKLKPELLDGGDVPIEWGLYIREGNEAMLDWVFFEEEKALNDRIMPLKNRLVEIDQEIMSEEKKQKPYASLVKLYEKQETLTGDEQQELNDARQELAIAKPRLEALMNERSQTMAALEAMSDETADTNIIASYTGNLPALNFTHQRSQVSNVPEHDTCLSFVLQGTNNCALNLLSQNLFNWLGNSSGRNEIREVLFDFNAIAKNEFWDKIAIDLLGMQKGMDKAVMMEKIHRLYRNNAGNTQSNILFVVRNNEKDDLARVQDALKKFWIEFTTLFMQAEASWKAGNPGVTGIPQHRVMAIILDEYCSQVKKADGSSYESSKKQLYELYCRADTNMLPNIHVLEVVHPLDATAIGEWQTLFIHEGNMRLGKDLIKEIVAANNGAFVPVVKTMIRNKLKLDKKKIEAESIVDGYLQKYY